jgi:glycosyltransferase involved in cell wall biosynthesis
MKISAVIISLNEEENIGRCLQSLEGVADEIVVVDSFSTDQTEAICSRYNVKFIKHQFEGYVEQEKFATLQASFDYILTIDADEALSVPLRNSIIAIKNVNPADAFSVNRLNNFCGSFIRFGEWNPDKKIRLWDRTKGEWGGENPHYQVMMRKGSTIKQLHGHLLHYTYTEPADHFRQMNSFSDIAAKEAFQRGKKTSKLIHLIFYPFFVFIRSYILKLGFLDGLPGYYVALHAAFFRYMKYLKLHYLWKKVS